MEIKTNETPTTDAYVPGSGTPTNPPPNDALVLEHSKRISFVIGGNEMGYVKDDGIWSDIAVWGAVGSDVADEIEVDNKVNAVPGKVYVFDGKRVRLSEKKAERGLLGIATDTASVIASNSDDKGDKLKVAVAGFVPSFVDKDYKTGTALTSGKDGVLTRAGFFVRVLFPERIVGTLYKKSRLSSWKGVDLKNRVLVKVG